MITFIITLIALFFTARLVMWIAGTFGIIPLLKVIDSGVGYAMSIPKKKNPFA